MPFSSSVLQFSYTVLLLYVGGVLGLFPIDVAKSVLFGLLGRAVFVSMIMKQCRFSSRLK